MKRIIPILLTICLLLAGCQKAPAEETQPSDALEVTQPPTETVEVTQEVTLPPETQPTEPEITFRNPLNGTPMDSVQTLRPYAVVINNSSVARPLCAVDRADILYEYLVEGGSTRLLAVYSDLAGIDHIGSIRSARVVTVDLAMSLDALFIHHGASDDGWDWEYDIDIDFVDAIINGGGGFYRDQNRLNSGYGAEHTSFADSEDLLNRIDELGYARVRETGIDYGYQFADNGSAEQGDPAQNLTAMFGAKESGFAYDQQSGEYVYSQYGSVVTDGNSGEEIAFRNVIVMQTQCRQYSASDNHMDIELNGSGDGFFACDGKVIPIRWSREGLHDPITFTDLEGNPITLGVGSTYIGIVPLSGTLEYE